MAKDYAKYLIGYTISDDETRNKWVSGFFRLVKLSYQE